jgi:DHA2 family multidrug resistance protein
MSSGFYGRSGFTRQISQLIEFGAVFNRLRLLTAALAVAVLSALLDEHLDHLPRPRELANWARQPSAETLATLIARYIHFGSDPRGAALKQMLDVARRHVPVISHADLFMILTGLFAALAALALVMGPTAGLAGARVAH